MESIGQFSHLKVSGYSIGSWWTADSMMIEVAKTTVLKLKTIVEDEVTKSDKFDIEILFKP